MSSNFTRRRGRRRPGVPLRADGRHAVERRAAPAPRGPAGRPVRATRRPRRQGGKASLIRADSLRSSDSFPSLRPPSLCCRPRITASRMPSRSSTCSSGGDGWSHRDPDVRRGGRLASLLSRTGHRGQRPTASPHAEEQVKDSAATQPLLPSVPGSDGQDGGSASGKRALVCSDGIVVREIRIEEGGGSEEG